MTFLQDRISGRRRLVLIVSAAVVVGFAAVAMLIAHHTTAGPQRPNAAPTTDQPRPKGAAPEARPRTGTATADSESLTDADQSALDATIASLRAMLSIPAATSPTHRPISTEARSQPDLYAAALVRGLLTQNYRTERHELLAWVQSESAPSTEPSVVGLIPQNLRPKLAVASVQEGFDGPGPVPAPGVWEALAAQHAHTTVVIQRVIEPVPWSAAVAAGQITDPGVTAREVDAQVTLHTVIQGQARAKISSVALTLNLEGPPVRGGYGLVSLISYTVKQG